MKKKTLINEVRQLQKIAGILKEELHSDLEKIENFVYSHPSYENSSPEELKGVINAMTQEWEASKNNYSTIEDYFDELETRGDFY